MELFRQGDAITQAVAILLLAMSVGQLGRDPVEVVAAAAAPAPTSRAVPAAFWQSASLQEAQQKSARSTAKRWCCR
jgi:hypothetical protein